MTLAALEICISPTPWPSASPRSRATAARPSSPPLLSALDTAALTAWPKTPAALVLPVSDEADESTTRRVENPPVQHVVRIGVSIMVAAPNDRGDTRGRGRLSALLAQVRQALAGCRKRRTAGLGPCPPRAAGLRTIRPHDPRKRARAPRARRAGDTPPGSAGPGARRQRYRGPHDRGQPATSRSASTRASPDDVEGQAPQAELAIDNVGRALTQWVEAAGGGAGATVRVMQVLDIAAPEVEWELTMDVAGVQVDAERVTARLGFDPLLGRAAVVMRHDPQTSPGLF